MPLPPGLLAWQAKHKKENSPADLKQDKANGVAPGAPAKKNLGTIGAKQGPPAGHTDLAKAAAAKMHGTAQVSDLPEVASAKKMPIRKGKKKVTQMPPWMSSAIGNGSVPTGLPSFANAAAAKMGGGQGPKR